MNLLYIDKIQQDDRQAFINKMSDISTKLKVNPNWLMVVMNSESNLNPKAYNSMGGATGLIQFMPSTAISLGTTTTALRNMKASEQLDYVYKYFKPYAGKFKGAYDVYLVTFFPLAVGKPDNWVFETSHLKRTTIARQNPAIDLNKDSQITIAEFKKWFAKRIGEEVLKQIVSNDFFFLKIKNKNVRMLLLATVILVVPLGSLIGGYYLIKHYKN